LPGDSVQPCRNHWRVVSFNEEETARIDARCQRLNAGFRRSHFYLAASLRHCTPSRPAAATGMGLIWCRWRTTCAATQQRPIFSNQLSILFYRIEPRQVASLGKSSAN